ncbi:putative glycosyl hydrolase family 85 protein [Elsinoe australis]|uniref:Putative glycosyl hydrolase family 85 protein n=1 Tax=Elsinoe australis TaxID=40998 RepID=A0A4U7BEA3_9PEZI|nr:putative glycosyl hydrolase family 85 protein [Elsinoe australis]
MGWKDILRPIRDRLRDNLPQPDKDEGEENKRKRLEQRNQDRLRGFIYLESFDELDQWRSNQVEPHQRANVPLLRRPECCKTVDRSKSSVTLVHDYSGNYHDYEDVQSVQVDQKSYACSYLQYVDRFVYFSHKVGVFSPRLD